MVLRSVCVWSLLAAAPVMAQAPTVKEMKGYVVSIDDTTLVISNIRVGGAGQTFVMPAPKNGASPTWVADSSKPSGEKPRMVMMTSDDDKSPLQLTELMFAKGAFKAADVPVGSAIVVTYHERDGKKALEKIEQSKPE